MAALIELMKVMKDKDPSTALHNLAIEEAITDVYSLKVDGTKSRCETLVKLLKSLKNPPEEYEVNW